MDVKTMPESNPVLHYMCKYTPLELFAGFGVSCVRLESDTDSFAVAESLGHPNMCGYGKGLLEAAVKGEVRELVLVNCCDVVRRIYDILQQRADLDFLYLLDLPHRSGEQEIRLFAGALQKLQVTYAAHCGRSFDEEAFRLAWQGGLYCGTCDLRQTESQKRNAAEQVAREQGPTLSLLGAHSGAFLAESIRQQVSWPVKDETCVGNRNVIPEPAAGADLTSYAKALLTQMPCMRMADATDRQKLGQGAAGIIYHTMKFCDYYGFEYAQLTKQNTTPMLKIETDGTRQSEGQLATRVEAFAERLGAEKKKVEASREHQPAIGYTAGIDSGSTSTDVAILDPQGKLAGYAIVRTGSGATAGAEKALEEALAMAGIQKEALSRIVSTGYGRDTIGIGDASITEITCHARGAHLLYPEVRTIIDIGGQDSKVIRVDAQGAVQNFVMNDKCAAGTGRFLEMMARTMELSMGEMSRLGQSWTEEVKISSMCTVFAESEVVSLIARNTAPENIIHGLNASVALRTRALLKRIGEEGPYMMTGGVAKNTGLVKVLEQELGTSVFISEQAQLAGAIGAAILARE